MYVLLNKLNPLGFILNSEDSVSYIMNDNQGLLKLGIFNTFSKKTFSG